MSEEPAIDAAKVMELIPHRFPFLLIDRVLEVSEEKIVAMKNVSMGEPYFQGHFPGMPIMPGVLQIEAMAQAAAILAAKTASFDATKQVVFFVGIDKVKFRKPVVPGDQLRIEVTPLRTGRIWKLAGEITVDGTKVSEGEFLATVVDRAAQAP